MKHQIWGSPGCPFCDLAVELMEQQSFDYEYFSAPDNKAKFRTLFPEATTVPQIIFNGEKIGGYQELLQVFEDQNIFAGGASF